MKCKSKPQTERKYYMYTYIYIHIYIYIQMDIYEKEFISRIDFKIFYKSKTER